MLLQEWYNCFRYISFVSWWGRLEVVHSRTAHFKFAPPLSQWRTTRTFGLSIVRRLGPVSGSRVKKNTAKPRSCHALLVRHKMQVQIFKCYHFPEKCGCKRNKHHSTTTYHNPKNNKLQNKEKSSNMVGTPTVSLSLSLSSALNPCPYGCMFCYFPFGSVVLFGFYVRADASFHFSAYWPRAQGIPRGVTCSQFEAIFPFSTTCTNNRTPSFVKTVGSWIQHEIPF